MGEYFIGIFIFIIGSISTFIFGYGKLTQKIQENKESSKEKFDAINKKIERMESDMDILQSRLNNIEILLMKIDTTLDFLKERIK
jgi:uncharacterized protein Yka (UPF0111/DUF47 family)